MVGWVSPAGLLRHLTRLKMIFGGLLSLIVALYFVMQVVYLLTTHLSSSQAPQLFVTSLPPQASYWKTLAFFTRTTSCSLAGMKFLR